MRLHKSFALVMALALLAGCGRDSGHAKSDLLKMNYQFNAEDFVRAARAGDEKAVGLFLDAGMDVNTATNNGSTALIGAAENNATEVIKLLGKQNVAYDQKDKEGWTPLMKAIYGNKVDAVQMLAESSKDDLDRGLLLASLLGHTESAQTLLKAGAEVDAMSPEGLTSLTYARKSGNKALEKLLLDAGAEPQSNVTPVLTAATPVPTPNLAGREALLKDLKAMRASSEESWWKKFGLDLNDANIFKKDSDNDGFPNSEEFLADTSPIDPSSHPPAAAKLTWKGYHRESLPYSLDKVEEDSAVLLDKNGTPQKAKAGDVVGDWTVTQVRARKSVDKDGHPYDGSDLLVTDKGGQKIRLIPGIRPPASASYAEVKLPFSDESQHLRVGEELTLPNDGNRRYVVLDLREEQVVLKETKTGQTFTIGR
ncbi:MAG: Amuc_1099 family pilus-like system protein [Chthoniobacterales bacterium]